MVILSVFKLKKKLKVLRAKSVLDFSELLSLFPDGLFVIFSLYYALTLGFARSNQVIQKPLKPSSSLIRFTEMLVWSSSHFLFAIVATVENISITLPF